ncbi:hypothetical protein CDL15_Pgr019638 [Punica granatum]|uniref:Uncharacterized protein n=1 Tax=Punica granatum TaxID=22663 RepID=A0A218X6E5_PUNGR|nr:hypothetical protein CDL15_Pgr019638 [Punica granatum]
MSWLDATLSWGTLGSGAPMLVLAVDAIVITSYQMMETKKPKLTVSSHLLTMCLMSVGHVNKVITPAATLTCLISLSRALMS